MPGLCPYALALSRVPRWKWSTRAELLERVELTRKMIEQSPGQSLTIASLSRIAGLSERLFGDTYGISPRKMLSNQRMSLASELLMKGLDVTEASLAVSYSSLPTFCRRFKEEFGQTSKEFQRTQPC